MPSVEFNVNPRHDVSNLYAQKEVTSKGGMWGLKPFDQLPASLKALAGISDQQKFVAAYAAWFEKTYPDPQKLKSILSSNSGKWKAIEAKFFQTLALVTKHAMKKDKVVAFLSHGHPVIRDMEGHSWLVFDALSSPEKNLAIIMHELFLLHILSSPIAGKIEASLPKGFAFIAAELLSFVLNEVPFSQIGAPKWQPYPAFAQFQNGLAERYRQNRDFNAIVDLVVQVLKQNVKREPGGKEGTALKREPAVALQKSSVIQFGSFGFLFTKVWGIPLWVYLVVFILLMLLLIR